MVRNTVAPAVGNWGTPSTDGLALTSGSDPINIGHSVFRGSEFLDQGLYKSLLVE